MESRNFTVQQWCHASDRAHEARAMLVYDIRNSDFYPGNGPDRLGDFCLNCVSFGYHSENALIKLNHELLLSFFSDSLTDYPYSVIFLDLPDRFDDEDAYKEGLLRILDLIARYQPQAQIAWVQSGTASDIGRELVAARGGRFFDMTGKALSDLDAAVKNAGYATLDRTDLPLGATPAVEISHVKESLYWCIHDVADYAENDTRNRVLLVGDSICFGYYHPARALLEKEHIVDTYAMSYAPSDPAVFRGLVRYLQAHPYDAIHINLGMHQADYDLRTGGYEHCIRQLLTQIRQAAPEAKLCFALTTTIVKQENYDEFDEQTFTWIADRNAAARKICASLSVAVDDLYTLCIEKKPPKSDTHHFTDSTLLAEQVAQHVKSLLA